MKTALITAIVSLMAVQAMSASLVKMDVTFQSGSPVLSRYSSGFENAKLEIKTPVESLVSEFEQSPLSSEAFKIGMKNLFRMQAPGVGQMPAGIKFEKISVVILDDQGQKYSLSKELPVLGDFVMFDRQFNGRYYYYCQRTVNPCNDLGWK